MLPRKAAEPIIELPKAGKKNTAKKTKNSGSAD